MKKAVVAILAVAVLGALSLYTNDKKTAGSPAASGGTTTGVSQTGSPTTASQASANYKDGTYTGDTSGTPYGPVQVAAVINGGKITDIRFLQMPSDQGHSREVTTFSESPLKQSALAKQSANVDFVSGATDTSFGFEQSLQAALDQAQIS